MNWAVAAIAAAGAVWIGWMLGWPWIFDINHPDFNPMILVVGVLVAVAGWHAVKALRWRARSKAFGASDLEITSRTPAPLGGQVSGVLRLGRPVSATGDWTLKLTCFDIHETRDTRVSSASPYQRDAFPVWSETVTLPASTDTARGLPFRFQLPASVGPKPVRPLARPHAYFRASVSINIPGLRRIFTRNAPPVARQWTLQVSVPTEGPDFKVAFPIPVED